VAIWIGAARLSSRNTGLSGYFDPGLQQNAVFHIYTYGICSCRSGSWRACQVRGKPTRRTS